MKKPVSPFQSGAPNGARGFALIIILSAIVLLLALVVGFFSRVQSDIQSSASYQSAESARNLSDYAVNLVLTQIKAGTAGEDASGNTLAWASQPGAIRTYNTSGALSSVYKLYSSPTMVASSINPGTEASSLTSWSGNRALFTDLNEPLSGQYPILDPTAAGVVKGFNITNAPLESGTGTNTAPMPANWLYVLKNGQIVPPTGSGNTANVAGASASNPIIGRIAFWTDDDTSKININTAGGGPWIEPSVNTTFRYGSAAATVTYNGPGFSSFWSTPVVFTRQEGAMSASQPTQKEYQRYPGHPANTFLSAALPTLATSDDIYSILPRLQNQGSKGGSVLVSNVTQPVTPDSDRLFSSVDEMIFNAANRSTTSISKSTLESAKFFLTANSRAPDVNLFNEPRISMWPITTGKMTPYDRLIAFCETIPSTSSGKAYYFARSSPDSSTADLTPRNKDILEYLTEKTSEAVPGFGGTAGILGKYGASNRDQTITAIFDYIRSTNPRDTSQGNTTFQYSETGAVVPIYNADTQTKGFGRFPTISKIGLLFYGVGINQPDADQSSVTPDANRESLRATYKLRVAAPGEASPPNPGNVVMQAALVIEMFIPGQGFGLVYPTATISVTGLNNFLWNGTPMFSSDARAMTFRPNTPYDWAYANENISLMWGGRVGMRAVASLATNQSTSYPLAGGVNSPAIPCWSGTGTRPTFTFSGGKVTIDISSGGNNVQTLSTTFPPGSFPVPDLAPYVTGGLDFRLIDKRMQMAVRDTFASAFLTDSDVVRAMAVESGDFRLAAANKSEPNIFKEHPYYGTTKMMAHNFMINLPSAYFGAGLGTYGPASTSFVTDNAAYEVLDSGLYRQRANNWKIPTGEPANFKYGDFTFSSDTYLADTYSTSGVKAGSSSVRGDWDNGVGIAGDGPYINLPDEGSIGKSGVVGYLGTVLSITELGTNFFTPNRMIPSSVTLGSLPTQAVDEVAWQTLLFRPSPAGHAGLGTPPDYLLLDFFNMPVVEPYALSEPLSTAGRVNMNYQILPYTYIERSTAVRAVMRSEQMLAIPNSDALLYKSRSGNTTAKTRYRYNLDLGTATGTLKGFQDRFAANDIFRSPSEICSIWFVPDLDDNESTSDVNYADMPTWWDGFIATGDNSKESSYARIYPRLTTKSNTYTVHYRVQALRKPKNSANPAVWEEGKDKVQSEYRGATTIERYIDPNDPNIPDYITAADPEPLDSFYKFRIIGNKQFNP